MSCTDNSTFLFIYENCPSSSENGQIIKRHNRIFKKREVPRELSELVDLSLSCPPPPDFNISANYFLKYFDSDDDPWVLLIKAATGRYYKMTEVSSFIGRKWHGESEDHKEFYRKIAKEVKVLYEKRYIELFSSPNNGHVNLIAKKFRKSDKKKSSKITPSTLPPTQIPQLPIPFPVSSPHIIDSNQTFPRSLSPYINSIVNSGRLMNGNYSNNNYHDNDNNSLICDSNMLLMYSGENDDYPLFLISN
ncbi:4262_t:CDS:2 [Entrophospora sp. SA101]|nr:7452_t:CDS:2 [Entrophospora sp. SA101]CAJ0832845.1 4262_t:CDS:2 [Entrophospora sp. SA101]